MTVPTNVELSEDLLEGAAAIAEFLYGKNSNKKSRRKVYYLAHHSNMPFFKLKSRWCALKSELREYIQKQQRKHESRTAGDNHHNGRDGKQKTVERRRRDLGEKRV